MNASSPLRSEITELAWSLWVELGVSGWTGHHQRSMVDPEPLIVFTTWLGDTDARLRDEAADWCTRYGSWISASRLTNMVDAADEQTRQRFGEFAATVGAHSTVRWRGSTKPRPFEPTGKSRVDSFHAPSLISLRLRSILGVSARAEIIRVLLAAPNTPYTASDLVDEAGFKKRNIANALDSLRMGGVLEAERTRNQIRYRLRDVEAWRTLLGELPAHWPRWTRILPVISELVDAAERCRRLSAKVRTVELNKAVTTARSSIQAAELPVAPAPRQGVEFSTAVDAWLQGVVHVLAAGKQYGKGIG